ncbi:unnamed protein product [Paramecium pentaurelia]|uniref:Peptidase C1A papain C-terminal domain-containing protein n=1 Tax=Paramecium pentaurelia TaxID=43138 RepID=A0A8S1XKS1_9CILI|nr:unnamed protein product [Paramecium pentaurelia]
MSLLSKFRFSETQENTILQMRKHSVIEAEFAIKKGINVTLSAQNLMDCRFGGVGGGACDDSWEFHETTSAYMYARDQGILTESEYPYTGRSDS